MAQLIKPQIKWTEEKIALLKQEYPLGNKQELAKKLGIKYKTLKSAATNFGVKSLQDKNFYKLKVLFEDSLLFYYWMGFIMADGQIDNKGQLKLVLSIKDSGHLEKLANYLKIKTNTYKIKTQFSTAREYCRLNCQDAKYGKLLLDKFGLYGKPKTYFPPTKLDFTDRFFLAFLIGYIDGDGTFSKGDKINCDFIRIELHAAWLKILESFEHQLNKLGAINTKSGLNNRGFSYLKIYKHQNLIWLKSFAIKNNLPILERKWDSINLDRRLKRHVPNNILSDI